MFKVQTQGHLPVRYGFVWQFISFPVFGKACSDARQLYQLSKVNFISSDWWLISGLLLQAIVAMKTSERE